MQDAVARQFSEIRELLLRPSAENVSRATSRLESLAEDIARMRLASGSSEGASSESRANANSAAEFLSAVREQTTRMRDLLNIAARLYATLNERAEMAWYERHGFLCTLEMPRRALARL